MVKQCILFLLCFSFVPILFGQNLEKLDEGERNKKLIEIAKTAVLRYGPGYYREYKPPVIEEHRVNEDSGIHPDLKEKYPGRVFYTVIYSYNPEEESFETDYAAKVLIWADKGKVFEIKFGNRFGLYDLDRSSSRVNRKKRIMPFEKQPPRKPVNRENSSPPLEENRDSILK